MVNSCWQEDTYFNIKTAELRDRGREEEAEERKAETIR